MIGIIRAPYPFAFAVWLGAVAGVPDWVIQSKDTYEILASMLQRDRIFDMIPEKTLKAFRQVSGREPSYRNKNAAKCDIIYAVLRAVWQRV